LVPRCGNCEKLKVSAHGTITMNRPVLNSGHTIDTHGDNFWQKLTNFDPKGALSEFLSDTLKANMIKYIKITSIYIKIGWNLENGMFSA
jgi:hypothetical protein